MPGGQRGTSRTRIASPRARGECRRPASAADLRRSPRSRATRPLRPLDCTCVPDRRGRRADVGRRPRDRRLRGAHDRSLPVHLPAWRRRCGGHSRRHAGTSLLKVDLGASLRAVEALPTVASAHFDRAYPHTLRVVVVPERPGRGRPPGRSRLPRRREREGDRDDRPSRAGPRWHASGSSTTSSSKPGTVTAGDLKTAVAAVAPLVGSHFPGRVSSVTSTSTTLTLRLRSGLEVRLGDPLDVALKLAVAARVIPLLDAGTLYLDVAVPERPVSGTLNSQVEGQVAPSITP